ncbi:Protection of telomeres protein 1 [Phytophthora citrophthora]|uniref:Protection of telomeres protein 1 n=1 Tax=Phytophthora citrophthora TaxID=4793 RepID=A0AAD9LSP4_9STRA|nr:Protection of telomeres protein 1 [Phytophthora citrophthora]
MVFFKAELEVMSNFIGTVKRAYPLQALEPKASDGGELGTFGPGVGPCGPEASKLMVVVLENHILWLHIFFTYMTKFSLTGFVIVGARTTFETLLVFFYDKWAEKVKFLKRHASFWSYKLKISGLGLVQLQWEAGMETEERVQCVVVAERSLLRKTLDRLPQLFTFPHGVAIQVAYEEPQRLPESDQLVYLPPRIKPKNGKRTLDKATVSSPAYRYSSLSELVDGYADIYGVVINMTLPKKTNGRDLCMTVSVTDETCPTREKAIPINIFYPTIEKMPKITCVGDIIRFHKVKIQRYQDNIQGLCMSKATRHLVLRESTGGKLEQLTSSDTWTFELSDEKRARQLIKWSRTSMMEDTTLPPGCEQAPKLLSELKSVEGFVDLVVRVLYLDDSDEPVRLIVWDGSGNAADSDPLILQTLEDKNVRVPAKGLLKEVVMSSCWSLVRDMGFVKGILTWCRFRNLAVAINEPVPGAPVVPGRLEILRFREGTSIMLMPDFTLDVQHRIALLNGTPVASTQETTHAKPQPPSQSHKPTTSLPVVVTTLIPDHIQNKIPVTPLREILNSSKSPRKFHCLARVRSIWPTDIEKICKPRPDNSSEFQYSFALTIEEGNDSLNIIVYGKDAEHFLHGIPPCDLTKSTSSKTLLEKRLTALLKSFNAFHWCIKSYSVSLPPGHSAGPRTAVRYRLFETLLQCS